MAIFLLDTSIIVDAINNKKNRQGFLLELLDQGHTLACCPVNVAEVYAGMLPKEKAATDAFLESLKYYPITFPAARLAGELRCEHRRKGITLSVPDTLIAAVAIQNRLPLLTDNIKDFPMKDLHLYPLP